MKHLIFPFLILCILTSCKEEKVSVAELYADDYTIEWIKFNYDSIKDSNENYDLVEFFIPKDKSKDTLFNQVKFYSDGRLDKKHSIYYDLEVSATEKKHVYKAKIKVYSEYSNQPIREQYADFFFLNFYKDSTSLETKNFDNTNEYELEFINFHNNRFEGAITEYFLKDTIIENEKDKVNMRTIEIVLNNKENSSGVFIENVSLSNKRKFNFKEFYKTN